MTENSHNTAAGLKPGDKIGRYEIRELLGIGGQAVVYKCFDPELQRFVAVKHISTHLINDAGYLDQIRQNIRNLASLGSKSEAIVDVYDIIDNTDGLFYVMEFVEGDTLETLLRQADGPVENKAVLLILFRLAAALHDIHSAGIVHRDMKPSNIILTEGLRPKIIDFGVATLAGGDASMPLATTKYIAPEIYAGGTIDGRADLYAVGFMAYEMLIGREKFNEIFADITRDKHSETLRWMKWHGNNAVTAPELHLVNPNVPESLSALIARMIAKDPDKRFANAEEFGRAIRSDFSPKGAKQSASQQAASALLDEAMELRVKTVVAAPALGAPRQRSLQSDDTPTAPLPKGPMTPRTKRMLIGVGIAAIFLILVGGGVLIYSASQSARARAQSADKIYSEGIRFFKNRQYAQASKQFSILTSKHKETIQGKKSRVLLPMCKEYIAIQNAKWNQAVNYEDQASETIRQLQTQTSDEKFTSWLNDRSTDIENLSQARYSSRFYAEAMQDARSELKRAESESDFDEVFQKLKSQLNNSSITLTDQQSELAATMLQHIQSERLQYLFAAELKEGDLALQKDDLADAEIKFNNANAILTSGRKEVKFLPLDKKAEMRSEIEDRQTQLINRQKNKEVYNAIRTAEKQGDSTALIIALKDALKLKTLSKHERNLMNARLVEIQTGEKLTFAKQLIAGGNVAGARDAINDVLKMNPDSNEAKKLSVALDNAEKRAELVAKAKIQADQGNYNEALNLYQMGAKYGEDDEIQTQIVECKFNIVMANALELQNKGEYDKAEEAYIQAKTIKPASAARVETSLMMLKTQREYDAYIAKGNKAIKEQKWSDAIKMFEQAKKLQDDKNVQGRIELAKYLQHIDLGKKALDRNDLPAARWRFRMARKNKDTQEARDLIKKAGGDLDD